MIKILKYSIYDLIRSQWLYVYFSFYFMVATVLLFFNNDLSKAVITLMNIILILSPLIGIVFGITYFYSSKEFTILLLAQPVKRSTVFLGQYTGIAGALSLCLILGLGIPFTAYGLFISGILWEFILLLTSGILLTLIFTALAFNIGLSNDNKLKGFGYAILLWLLLAIVYDGLFLLLLILLESYPLDKFALAGIMLNPIDLSRILILLKFDISALMGYTGAIFKKFFGTNLGWTIALTMLLLWILIPILSISRISQRKDF